MTAGPEGGVVGVLLAGGLARRMGGGDKGLRDLAGRPLLDWVVCAIAPQVDTLILNAGGDPARFARWRLPVVADCVEGALGPLAGILTAMEWAAAHRPDCPWVLSAPTDAPFMPTDLVERLRQAIMREEADMACAASGGRTHPVVGLWPVRLRGALREALIDEGERKIDRWTARYKVAVVPFPADGIDPFFNANRPEDLDAARSFLADGGATG